VERLKASIAMQPEAEIEKALSAMVNQIFVEFSGNQQELSFEEWKKWFSSLPGIELVLSPSNGGKLPAG
jgi:hypothetical protein